MNVKKMLIFIMFFNIKSIIAQKTETFGDANSKKGFGIGINLSTNGIGGQVAYSFLNNGKLNGRLEARTLSLKMNDYEADINGTKLVADVTVKLGSVGAMIDFHPFGNAFKVTGGYAILLNDISGLAITKDSTKFGDISIPPDEVGTISFGMNVKGSPYIGIGFGRAVPKKRFGFTFEVGSYYTGAPNVTFKTTGMLEPTSANEPTLRKNLSGLTWWPVMNLGFNFRLGKIN
ncbi:MAG: hypothetical protein ACK4K9_03020 [Bacteroidia bacterium]